MSKESRCLAFLAYKNKRGLNCVIVVTTWLFFHPTLLLCTKFPTASRIVASLLELGLISSLSQSILPQVDQSRNTVQYLTGTQTLPCSSFNTFVADLRERADTVLFFLKSQKFVLIQLLYVKPMPDLLLGKTLFPEQYLCIQTIE